VIEVKNVSKTYGKKKQLFQALKNVTFTIPDGASVAIVGKSGSGKSTLMHAMSGLDRPQMGEILVDGVNILDLKPRDVDAFRSKKISFIFQSFFVQANESCIDNVSLPLEIAGVPRARSSKIIAEALEASGLSYKARSRARDLRGHNVLQSQGQ
jgi:putative ABC transport system ATP-binding protein